MDTSSFFTAFVICFSIGGVCFAKCDLNPIQSTKGMNGLLLHVLHVLLSYVRRQVCEAVCKPLSVWTGK